MKASTWKATLLLAVTFVLGALAGGAVVAYGERDRPSTRFRHDHREPRDHIGYLARRLDLTATQQDSVKAILERHQASMDSIWRQVGPRFGTLRDSISNDIRRQLTPDQVERYNDMIRRFEELRRDSKRKPR